jgi:DNA-binding NtrC family response regulator
MAGESRRLAVLVVDDESRFLASLQLVLEDVHDVVTLTSAPAALALVSADPKRFDVVLCDLGMPGVDGEAFYEHMVSLGVADRFVLMTGGAFTQRGADFIARRRCPTIGKPFLIEALLALLEKVAREMRT